MRNLTKKFILQKFVEYFVILVQIFLSRLNYAKGQTIATLMTHIVTLYTIFGESGEITFKLHNIVLINNVL
jgi:hypothetical protein